MSDAVGDDTRLPATGTCEDEQRTLAGFDSFMLLRIELGEKRQEKNSSRLVGFYRIVQNRIATADADRAFKPYHTAAELGNIVSASTGGFMKVLAVLAWFLLLGSLCAQTQGQAQQPSEQPVQQKSAPEAPAARQPKIDPGKEADIRRLLDLTGAGALATQTMDGMEKNIRPLMTGAFPPGEYREKLIDLFFAKFHSKRDPQQLLELAIPLYDKYYSAEDIKALIQFYATPVGQKALTVLPKLMHELQEEGRKWGEGLGRESMLEVFSEHPELEKALEDAKKNAQSR